MGASRGRTCSVFTSTRHAQEQQEQRAPGSNACQRNLGHVDDWLDLHTLGADDNRGHRSPHGAATATTPASARGARLACFPRRGLRLAAPTRTIAESKAAATPGGYLARWDDGVGA